MSHKTGGSPPRKIRHALWIVPCLLSAAILPYLGVLNSPLVFDDLKLVRDNRFLRLGAEDPQLLLDSFDITSSRWEDDELRPNYRPLRFLSYFADYQLSRWWYGDARVTADLPTFFFHLSNVLIHAVNTLLVAGIAAVLRAADRVSGRNSRDRFTDCPLGPDSSEGGYCESSPAPAVAARRRTGRGVPARRSVFAPTRLVRAPIRRNARQLLHPEPVPDPPPITR